MRAFAENIFEFFYNKSKFVEMSLHFDESRNDFYIVINDDYYFSSEFDSLFVEYTLEFILKGKANNIYIIPKSEYSDSKESVKLKDEYKPQFFISADFNSKLAFSNISTYSCVEYNYGELECSNNDNQKTAA